MNQKKTAKAVLAAFTLSAALPFSALAATDIQGHWAENVLTEWENGKLLSGYEDGTIRPDQKITRAEFVSLVNRAAQYKYEGNKITFTDVKDGDWYYQQVAIAANKGFVGGFEDNTFRPGEGLTRGEAASILARLEKLEPNADKVKEFKDADKVPAWAAGAIGAVAEKGFMVGDPDGSFHAERVLSRAEAVAALDRAGIDIVEPVEPEVPEIPPFIPGGGGGGGSAEQVPVETLPTVDPNVSEQTQQQIIDKIEEAQAAGTLKIETTVEKDGTNVAPEAPAVETAVTEVVLPNTLKVKEVVLPDTTPVTVQGKEIALKAPITVESTDFRNGKKEFKASEILQYVDTTKTDPDALSLLTSHQDEVLVTCTKEDKVVADTNKTTLTWDIKGMTKEEQQRVFAELQVMLGLKSF